jgi:hypothetical protein
MTSASPKPVARGLPVPLAQPPVCPYCQKTAELDDGTRIYGHTRFGHLWVCPDYPSCNAYVGCHPADRGYAAKGRLADPILRRAKIEAHAAFDPLWRAKMRSTRCSAQRARDLAYGWLARQMGLSRQDCHIGMFDLAGCQRVIELCQPHLGRRGKALASHAPAHELNA